MSLLEDIRDACPAGFWSRGVQIARDGGVVGVSATDDEIVLKVTMRGARVPFTVHLWPDDEDWSCDCEGAQDACAHSAAGVIAWSQAKKSGHALPQARPVVQRGTPASLRYRLESTDQGFRIHRLLVLAGREQALTGPLQGRSVQGPMLNTEGDLAAEEILGHRWGQVVPRERVRRLLIALEESTDITLDGEPIRVSGQPVVPVGRVEDAPGGGFRVRIVRAAGIEQVLRNGAVLIGGELRPVGDGGLSRRQRTILGAGMNFDPDDVGRLVSQMLPDLRSHISVEVHTARLPDASTSRPRLLLETTGGGDRLGVRPVVVYGDPPVARVDRGELKLLGGAVPVRDQRAESRLISKVRDDLRLAVGIASEFRGSEAVRFVDRMDKEWRGKTVGDAWRRFRRVEQVDVGVRVDGRKLHVDARGADPHRMLKAWQDGEEMVQVNDGWAPLPLDWLNAHGHLLADLLAARDAEDRVPRHAVFDLAELASSLDQPEPAEMGGLRALLGDFAGIPTAPLPDGLQATLRDYQHKGLDWLTFLRSAELGGILADDMGLGKTLQALCALRGRSLVVAPTSVLTNWKREAQRFRPDLRVSTYHGASRVLDPNADVTFTSYGLLRLDADLLSEQMWDAVVLDEAQAIKNPDSKVARAAFRLQATFRLALTGTPVENRLEELWSQLHFTNPGLLGGRSDFKQRYARPIGMGDAGTAAHLRRRIRPFILRRMKSQVARELPPRTDMVLHNRLNADERAVYDAVRAATRERIVEQLGAGGGVMAALEALLRLRQASCHSGLLPGQHADRSTKVELLLDTLEELISEGHKALVFSQWTGLLDRVQARLRERDIAHVRLDGSTRDRGAVVDRFQADDGPPVFLISLKAGGTGLNLTAADHVFLLDPWWNPAVEDQAADRAHRIGQDRPVMVYRLVSEDTVEERILALQERKRALAEAALGEAGGATSITRDDLMELLR